MSTWDSSMILTLRKEWKRGTKAREIGEKIGVSKDAVIAQARRLRLTARAVAGERSATTVSAPSDNPLAGCLMPMWNNREAPTHRYCGKPRKPGSSYCEECHRIVWVKPTQKLSIPKS